MCSCCGRIIRDADGPVQSYPRALPGGLVIYERQHVKCPRGELFPAPTAPTS